MMGFNYVIQNHLFKSLHNVCCTKAQNHTIDIVKALIMINMAIKIDTKY